MKGFVLTEADIERVKEVAWIMQQSLKSHYTIAQWADKVKLPEKRLKRAFKEVHGAGLYTYLRNLRMEKAKEMLREDKPIKVIILYVGYKNEGNFSKAFRKVTGQTPRSWKAEAN
ncbi:MAG: helix-turn-helix transcriptional regulator [Niastella sp.]|nr:helix-turn-helix transcriptional regulator [Niastella sp.]